MAGEGAATATPAACSWLGCSLLAVRYTDSWWHCEKHLREHERITRTHRAHPHPAPLPCVLTVEHDEHDWIVSCQSCAYPHTARHPRLGQALTLAKRWDDA